MHLGLTISNGGCTLPVNFEQLCEDSLKNCISLLTVLILSEHHLFLLPFLCFLILLLIHRMPKDVMNS